MLQQTLVISVFQLAHKKEPVRTAPKPQVPHAWENQSLPSGPKDCEPSVELEDFGEGGVGVEVESEYDLELRIGGKRGSARDRAFKLVDSPKQCTGEMVEGEDEPQRLH